MKVWMEFPILNDMTDLDLILLHYKVADSDEPTDVEFKKAILQKLRERHITVTARNVDDTPKLQNIKP